MNTVIKAYTLSECMESMAECVESYQKLEENIIFCEDRLTLIAERALMARLGGSFYSSVSTFARFLKAEGKTVSKQGSVMMVGEVMTRLQREGKLQCFTSAAGVAKNARGIYETLAQFSASEITPELLRNSLELLPEGTLKKKVSDFAYIFEGYKKALLEQGLLDESRYLSLLPKSIEENGLLKGKNVFFLCYTSFTAQAKEVIRTAIKTAKNVIGIFCADDKALYTNRAYEGFLSVCNEFKKTAGEPLVKDMGTPLMGEAEVLRAGLFNPERPASRMATDKINLFEAEDKTAEAEYVAVKIRRAMAENSSLRYRDFAVLTPSVKDYSLALKKAFEEYGIPFFIDEKKSIKQHPLSKFLLDCCRAVKENYSPASVQALTQNYFFGESDEYRNYLYKFANYRGGAKNPIKTGESVEKFLGVNKLPEEKKAERFTRREEARARLMKATENIKARGYGRGYCAAIRKILADFEAETKLEKLDNALTDVAQKGYLSQIYRALDGVLLEAELLMGGKEMTVTEFAAILEDGFDAMEISLIPLKTDAVFIGDITESRIEKVSSLFALGMTDAVPINAADTAIVSDKEIKQLKEVQAVLEPTVAEVNLRSRESLCLNLCTFLDKLYLSYPLSASGGEPALSEVFRYIHTLFKATEEKSAFAQNASHKETEVKEKNLAVKKGFEKGDFPYQCSAVTPAIRQMLVEKAEYETRKSDSMEDCSAVYIALKKLGVVEGEEYWMSVADLSYVGKGTELFFHDGKISPTTLEKYFACPFGHFAEKGLHLQEREEAVVLATDSGKLVHSLLKEVIENARKYTCEEDLRNYAYDKCRALLESSVYRLQQDTDAGSYAIERMLAEAVEVSAAAWRNIVNSNYNIEKGNLERRIEGELFKGQVDRIDTTEKYVRVIDYKTGNITSAPGAYYTGQKIQMELYMSEVKGERIPAGVFYFPSSLSFVSKEGAESRFRMEGFMNGSEDALKAGDVNIKDEEKSEYFEASLKDNGRLAKVMDEKTFVDFLDYAVLVAKKGCEELKEGYIAPSPYEKSCKYCKYGGMCGFNREVTEERKEGAITPTAIAEIVRKEREEGNKED